MPKTIRRGPTHFVYLVPRGTLRQDVDTFIRDEAFNKLGSGFFNPYKPIDLRPVAELFSLTGVMGR